MKQKRKDKYKDEKQEVTEIYKANKGRYGYRRICAVMKAKGWKINHKTVLKLMKSLQLCGKQSKSGKYRSYKGEVGKVAENLLHREFYADKPFKKLTTDVTEFKIGNEKVYLSPVLDTVRLWRILFPQVPICNRFGICWMACFRNFLRMQDLYSIRTKVGNTSMQYTKSYLQSIILHKVCPERETVWTMASWKTSSAD